MAEISWRSHEESAYRCQLRQVIPQQRINIFQFRKKFPKVHKLNFEKHQKSHIWPGVLLMHLDDNLSQIDFITWRQISKSLFTLIFPQMLKQLMKNAEDPENQDKLLDSGNRLYRDNKSKEFSLEISFTLTHGHFSDWVFFFGTPCIMSGF